MKVTQHEEELCRQLKEFPRLHENRFNDAAHNALLRLLFRSLAGFHDDVLPYFFPNGTPTQDSERWSLKEAQGAVEGAEYTEAARGLPCGHIFKSGEATYRCKTCTVDDTCVLCAKCFDASDHEGHMVFVSISPGNSGCCDCGDPEAWIRPVHCNIHTAGAEHVSNAAGKQKESHPIPAELSESIRVTISRVLDYFCDVFSCSPEQLRLPKTEESIRADEKSSRLNSKWYGGLDALEEDKEFALVLWNDEKHTVIDVQDQVARACKARKQFGLEKAHEVDELGRSVVMYKTDLKELLKAAKIIEDIKLTVSIRSARDTFREQMCGAIVEWITDIAGCSVGNNHEILRNTICEEMLKAWRVGSEAHHSKIGIDGIDDHEVEDNIVEDLRWGDRIAALRARTPTLQDGDDVDDEDEDDDDDDDNEDDADNEWEEDQDDDMDVDLRAPRDADGDVEMDISDLPDDDLETSEATLAGYPPPPPPPPPRRPDVANTPADSEGEPMVLSSAPMIEPLEVPKTPRIRQKTRPPRSLKHWLEKPEGYNPRGPVLLHENLWKRVRLDWMILYDLRMWKKVRVDLRDVFISTVVTIPHFKRILGLRFAGLYTTLAQLYLIADREPDHSIINLSLQMLTTPSITAEVVERGNFLTNLMAILYTFLTTRQVGYPWQVNPLATLAFDQGAVTNRRMYHFFLDMKYLLGSEHVKAILSNEPRYLLQFLDLVKLHQGICPNVRAVGEHLEYETDAWISASLITKEISRLCRQFAEAYTWNIGEDNSNICQAIRDTAKTAIIHTLGAERRRFDQTEIKKELKFFNLDHFEFEPPSYGLHSVVDFAVAKEHMSFHHALHYTLSWLIDRGKGMSRERLVSLLTFSAAQLKEPPVPLRAQIPTHESSDYMLALFDPPLRVCAWLAQMRANTWIRNGITLRHQMSHYRGVLQRDVCFQRDIFLLQVGLVVCPTARFLASMVDRFGLTSWVTGTYDNKQGFEDQQVLDIAEDFVHLLIILLSDRTSLVPNEDEPNPQLVVMKRDIIHILCFKPLSHSDLSVRLPDKIQDLDEFQDILMRMTDFRPPEGLSDTGTFSLKAEYYDEIDPYIAHYNRNQREEAESIYKKHIAKKTGKDASDIVFEPKLRPIQHGVFQDLAAFTNLPLFTQVIYYFLAYALRAPKLHPNIPTTKLEAFLQFTLQLLLVALPNDESVRHQSNAENQNSLPMNLISIRSKDNKCPTALSLLYKIADVEAFKSCTPKINVILRRLQQREPQAYAVGLSALDISSDRMDTGSPAVPNTQDKELKKKQALERQARVMAQFKQQQSTFLANQTIDWGEDFSDSDDDVLEHESANEKLWKYPAGTCILCQEETNDERLYGTFSFIANSRILRQTEVSDPDWVTEVIESPSNLDYSAESIRPYGVAGKNRKMVTKVTSEGKTTVTERQGLGKGFPQAQVKTGPVATGCGHIMHYHCFEVFVQATNRRHMNQIARHHPERPDLKEFLCPLCKAIGNIFLPIIWKGKLESYPSVLSVARDNSFDAWLENDLANKISQINHRLAMAPERPKSRDTSLEDEELSRLRQSFYNYGTQELIAPLAASLNDVAHRPTEWGTTPALPLVLPPPQATVPSNMGNTQEGTTEPVMLVQEQPVPPVASTLRPLLELVRIYQRLRDTLKVNNITAHYQYNPTPPNSDSMDELTRTDALAQCLGYTISSTEIAQRGVASDVGTTLLDSIPSQTMTHLRILSETVSSYVAIGGVRSLVRSKSFMDVVDQNMRQLHQLFIGHPQMATDNHLPYTLRAEDSILKQDPFVFLTECSTFVVPGFELDIYHVMRLCYIAEIVRVVLAYAADGALQGSTFSSVLHQERNGSPFHFEGDDEQRRHAQMFIQRIAFVATHPAADYPTSDPLFSGDEPMGDAVLGFLQKTMNAYALPFVRKAAILMHVRYGVDFPNTGLSQSNMSELQRLTLALKLPSLAEMFGMFAFPTGSGFVLRSMVAGWIRHMRQRQTSLQGDSFLESIDTLSHPAIFELVGLPKNYDTLTDEAIKRRCPTTGKDLSDPAVCLFCGEIFCSQAVCCKQKGRGGCNNHLEKCGGNVGIFINIRKCMVLYLNSGHGSWATAPYLDSYGEVDPTLRRHHQLFLHQKRYDALLRSVWLNHGIPTAIARRLDGENNSGGWETL